MVGCLCMYNNVVPFQAKSFPTKGIWRVHAFGEVRRNPKISSEPTVDLFIVPLKFDSDKGIDLNNWKSYDYNRLQSVKIGVGQITGICVGSLLKDQRRMYRLPDYTLKRFTFNAENDFRKIIRAGASYRKDGKTNLLFRDNYYKVPQELSQMPCLVFNAVKASDEHYGDKDAKKKKLVIPCWTVFQYYYATSSRLSTSLINGELEIGSNQIYNPDPILTHHDPVDGYFYLRLRQRMLDKDARTIARIAADERIAQFAKNISNSMIANFNSGKGAFPEVYLPFFGDTIIEVSGKDIQYEGGWFFLVYNIRSCTGEFPYNKLKFDRDNDNQQVPFDDPNLKPGWNTPKKHVSKSKPKEDGQKITDDAPPSLNIIETEIVLPSRNFISQPTVSLKLPKKICKYRSARAEVIIRTNGTKKDLSTGEGESNGESARLDIKTNPENETRTRTPRESASPDFDSMLQVLETIQEDQSTNFYYNLITVIEDDKYEQTGFSVFPDYQNGKRVAWSFIPGNTPRRRQVMVVEMIYKGACFYLFEIERRVNDLGKPTENFHTVIIHKNLTEIDLVELEYVLSYITKNEGVCSDSWEFVNLIREKFRHSWTVESFAKKLKEYFEEETFNVKPSINLQSMRTSDNYATHLKEIDDFIISDSRRLAG